jgi:hypothetical protein
MVVSLILFGEFKLSTHTRSTDTAVHRKTATGTAVTALVQSRPSPGLGKVGAHLARLTLHDSIC